ncbi:MAG: HAD family hydrolase [Propionibacteriaceae bacterium]|jgi:Cof subfamily protein (haloacid dehalogenase superfamily)|nr:HAD family hydrolase [Propionibacteriaceae bacterium]
MTSSSRQATPAPIAIIATDLDGTFLGADHWPTPLNVEALHRAQDAGVRIVFATGRPARWVRLIEPLAGLDIDLIASNGAAVSKLGVQGFRRLSPLPGDDTLALIADLRAEWRDLTFAAEYDQGWGRMADYPELPDAEASDMAADLVVEQPRALIKPEGRLPLKLLIRGAGRPLPTDELFSRVDPLVAGRLNLTFSLVHDNGFLELSAPGVSKASALQDLLADYGLAASQLAAFGDMPNDLEMLRLAGRPFAMGNAHPLVLAEGFEQADLNSQSGFGKAVMALLAEQGH